MLTGERSGVEGQEIWTVTEEANHVLGMLISLVSSNEPTVKKLQQFGSNRIFILLSPYRASKQTLPWDIGGLSPDGTMRLEQVQLAKLSVSSPRPSLAQKSKRISLIIAMCLALVNAWALRSESRSARLTRDLQ